PAGRGKVSDQAVPCQRQQPQDVPAITAEDEARALAGAVGSSAEADVIEPADAEAVDREASTPDVATDLVKGVEGRAPGGGDAEDADAVAAGRADQADRALAGSCHPTLIGNRPRPGGSPATARTGWAEGR